ncbi:MAG: hypothetical protein H6732_01935 [Alphaproteobacteria bacterium]|nr:hypothetical protein [Alphaproteobacteria bacterium]
MRCSPCLLLALLACTDAPEDAEDTDTGELAPDPFWTDLGEGPPAIPPALGLPADAPAPSGLWSAPDPARTSAEGTSHLGYFAVGNGSLFGVVGVGIPANTLHGVTGPDYDKAQDAYWPDVGLQLVRGGVPLTPTREAVFRLEGTAVVLTRLEAEGLALWTLDAAVWSGAWPAPPDADVPLGHRWIVRRVLVEDLDGQGVPPDVEVRTTTGSAFAAEGAWLRRDQPGRTLWVGERDEGAPRGTVADGAWRAPAGDLGTPVELLVGATYDGETLADLPRPAPDALGATVERWRTWSAQGMQLTEGPARLRALLDANKVAIRTQLAARGEPCPMVFYTRMWNRDLIGPVRLFLALGLEDDATAMLDAHWTAVRQAGDLANSYASHRDPRDVTTTPDFEARTTPYDGRSRAEGPSYTPLAYQALWRATGRADRGLERLGLLVRAVRGQERANGLLPFSGDETFRPQMATSFGLPITFLFEEETWSANSGLLWVAAAEAVQALATEAGRTDLVDELGPAVTQVREATETTFRQADGSLLPFVFQDGTPPPPSPYPDVALKEAWSGYRAPLDPAHLRAVDATVDAIWDPEGLFLAPLDPSYVGFAGLDIERGIMAGMSPGYGTWTLARTFRPELADAARFLASAVDPGGTWPEVLVVDDRSGLTPFYLGTGFTETWARYRPWEGGIDMEALLVAALGLEADARTGTLRLSPGLPGMGPLRAEGVPVGAVRVDVHHLPGPTRHALEVRATAPVTVRLEVCARGEVTADGEPLATEVLVDDAVRHVVAAELALDDTPVTLAWPAACR